MTATTVGINEVIAKLEEELVAARKNDHEHLHFDMGNWLYFTSTEVQYDNTTEPTWCGTAACISGTAVLLDYAQTGQPLFYWDANLDGWETVNVDWIREGARILGIDSEMAYALFITEQWPAEDTLFNVEPGDEDYDLVKSIAMLKMIRDGRLSYRPWEIDYDDDGEESEVLASWVFDGEDIY